MSLQPHPGRGRDAALQAGPVPGTLRTQMPAGGERLLAHFAAVSGRVLIAGIEHCAALIVLVELLILFAGVVSRYVFGNPLTWSDDVATLLFVWLSMLGAVVALARGQHLRLTVAEKWLSPRHDLTRHLATQLLSLIFLGSLFFFSIEHLADARGAMNPILGISEAWRAAGLTAGLGLMALFCLCQIIAAGGEAGWPRVGTAALLAACGSAVFYCVSWITGGTFDLAPVLHGPGRGLHLPWHADRRSPSAFRRLLSCNGPRRCRSASSSAGSRPGSPT